MKKLPLITFIVFLIPLFSFSQEIYSIDPDHGSPGQKGIPMIITCLGINNIDEYTGVEFDNLDITVNDWEAADIGRLNVMIGIADNASPGKSGITINLTNEREITKAGVFEIKPTGLLDAFLTIIPADPLYLSSFDPDDPANSPLLFLVNVNNDSTDFYLTVKFTVSSSDYGEIGYARKHFKPSVKNVPISFDNREFDEYEISSTAGALLDEAMQSGLLPPGTYEYKLTLHPYGDEGTILGGDIGYNEVTNLITSIDLIGPGNPTNENPEIVYSPNPYFQWFSMANAYDFTLYEVMEGQTAPDEITTNLPVYQETNLGTTQFLYPNYAELLEIGKTYAWQVKAYFEGSMGQETIFSDVFWFSYQQCEGVYLDHIVVLPEEVTLYTGESYQFHAVGINANGDTLQIECTWQVVPSNAGNVDDNGFYIDGNNPIAIAVVAQQAGLQAYSTVTLVWTGFHDHILNAWELLKEVFGMPN